MPDIEDSTECGSSDVSLPIAVVLLFSSAENGTLLVCSGVLMVEPHGDSVLDPPLPPSRISSFVRDLT